MKKSFVWLLIASLILPMGLQTEFVHAEETEFLEDSDITVLSAEEVTDFLVQNITEEQLSDDTDAEDQKEDSSGFSSMRLIVASDEIPEDYGAVSVIKYENLDDYLLQYDSEEAAACAYAQLSETLGEEKVYSDELIQADDILAEVDYEEYPCYREEGRLVTSWGTEYMGMDDLKNFGEVPDQSVTVAVIDTGMDADNAYFSAGRISSECYDFGTGLEGPAYMDDTNGHGTAVANLLMDATSSNVILMPLRIDFSDNTTAVSMILAALSYAIDHGADLINMSLTGGGSDTYGQGILDDALERADEENVIVVAAAGNSAGSVPVYPASSPYTIAVGALDTDGTLAYYSNKGSDIDFTAPGSNIACLKTGETCDSFEYESGTSMAAPEITAAYAWLKLYNPNASKEELYQKLTSYCTDLGDTGKDRRYGNGVPDLTNLVNEKHRHDFVVTSCRNGTHTKKCTICGYTKTMKCQDYTLKGDGSFTCSLCGYKLASTYSGRTLNVSSKDKSFLNMNRLAATVNPVKVVIQSGYTTITYKAFCQEQNLKYVTFPDTLTLIKADAFRDCPLVCVNLSGTALTTIRAHAFENTAISYIRVPSTLKIIGDEAFYGDTSITEIDFYATKLKSVGVKALAGCTKLKKIQFPKNLAVLKAGVFSGDKSLEKVYFSGDFPVLTEDDDENAGTLEGTDITAYYPKDNATWDSIADLGWYYQYGGTVKWACYSRTKLLPLLSIKLSKTSYTYDGKAKKPKVTVMKGKTVYSSGGAYTVAYRDNVNPGTATAVVSARDTGIYGFLTLTYTIRPKGTTVKSISACKNGFKIYWKKQSTQITGYQIQYARNRKFSSAVKKKVAGTTLTSQKLTGLKANRTYYVRIRTYKNVSGKSYYSTWSSVKKVKTK